MRTEYTIKITDKNGKSQYCTYSKSYAFSKYDDIKNRYADNIVELFKVVFNGSSLYKAEKIF